MAESDEDGDDAPAVAPVPETPIAVKEKGLFRELYNAGLVPVFLLAIFHNAALQAALSKLLVYMEHMDWASDDHLSAYTVAYVTSVIVPFVTNPVATYLQSKAGIGTTLTLGQCVAMCGYLMIALIPHKYFFITGWGIASVLTSLRSARQAAVALGTPGQGTLRTRAMALLSATNPVGSLLGSVVSRFVDWQCNDCSYPSEGDVEDIYFNDYTIVFYCSAGTCLLSIMLSGYLWGSNAVTKIKEKIAKSLAAKNNLTDKDSVETSSTLDDDAGSVKLSPTLKGVSINEPEFSNPNTTPFTVTYKNGKTITTTVRRFVFFQTVYFCTLIALVNFVNALYGVTLQPILKDTLNMSKSAISNIYIITTAASVIPALLVIPLTKRYSDDKVILGGVIMKIIGMLLYAFPPAEEIRVVAGFVLVQKASFFFFTCLVSKFTKILQRRCAQPLGALLSVAAASNCVATVVGGTSISSVIGTYYFLIFVLPALVAMLLIIFPPVDIDPTSPLIQKVAQIGAK
eukprot:TRINITY_DN2615_c4_g1_i1.p1 TRINITY_DN2615_c4_g1~~TRINITY_DN2615_c4_g1_i1.p1  ORF type:complete len:560 (+),score=114.34 TRINITY_DN2615_c4_g1_i1:139-1680(+)